MPHEEGMCDPPFEYLRAEQMLWRKVLDICVIGYRDAQGVERSDTALEGFDEVPLPVLAYVVTCLMNHAARRHHGGFEAGIKALVIHALDLRVEVDPVRPALSDAFAELVITTNLERLGEQLRDNMRSLSPKERAALLAELLKAYCSRCGRQLCGSDDVCACVGAE